MRTLTSLRLLSANTLVGGLVTTVLVIAALVVPGSTSAQEDPVTREPDIVVCPTCEVQSLSQAVSQAQPGALIEVRGGEYPAPVVIERDLELIGIDNPVIDGGGSGTVVAIRGAAATIRGFTIRGTGTSLHHEDSAILVDSGKATIESNRIEDALFGIYMKNSPGSILRDNLILSKPLPIALRGDGIRVWHCDDTLIENNVAQDGRDAILWYSNRGVVRNNQFDRGRYGLHLMFSDSATIEGNSLRANSIGLYIMYSRNASIIGNSLSDNHGPSGGGLGLKDVDGAEVLNNRFVNNRMGAQVDTSPREPNIEHHWQGNVFAYNQSALGLMPAVRNNTFTDNAFIDNIVAVEILGGGQLRDITWALDGHGNYWSDYVGYDADGDGIGDAPYRSQQLFESLIDQNPQLRIFMFSPAAMAIDFASRAFPEVRPREKFVDPAPLMSPPDTAGLPAVEKAEDWKRVFGAGAGLVTAGVVFVAAARVRRRSDAPSEPAENEGQMETFEPVGQIAPLATEPETGSMAVSVSNVTKKYGDAVALNDIDFDVAHGEAIAMWGPNGAGKTTVLRCLLGIARFSGHVRINGMDPVSDGPAVRNTIGFVPQDLAPSPTPVGEMASFIARLKGASEHEAHQHLARLGIADQIKKPVSALSGGMKQRLALALALIGSPSLLLLDEPTANLDAAGRSDLLDLLQDLKRTGMTLVFSSHRPDDVLALADRILILERGSLTGQLTPEEFSDLLDSRSRLVVTLANGHLAEALATLERLGYEATSSGKMLSIPVHAHGKAQIISALAREGVEIADFEMESTA